MNDERDQFAELSEVRMCYRDEGNPAGEPLLLIMGLSSQLIHWPQEIVDRLGERYRVIRPDNRDSGLTEWKGDPKQYFLRAIARDTVELLDHLGIDRAHVVGASMGGMVAQLLAIEHGSRVLSLCSIMSTPHVSIGMAEGEVLEELTKPLPEDRDEAIAQIAALYALIGSKTHADSERARRLDMATRSYDRAQHPQGSVRQVSAALMAPNRTEGLRGLRLPALVVHGGEDSLIEIAGGEATHAAIAGSTYLPLADMGHDLPQPLLARIATEIQANASRAAAVV
ncbi:alpha/beta fold hydrolase [Nocardia asteroides]|uniref:alpha/beta fold hydrolase n=1 Tax=Nocardia asteroides TaxID=1824 RepID=UPI001E342582|nr:alpha/beta hydrolase [Nocardia asteroides]UGT62534.1 alpha/beta hydrolase [Nocardia asteroides]